MSALVQSLPGAVRGLPTPAAAVVAGVVGLMVGSFMNVVVYRVPRRLSISKPRSFCPNCGTTLRAVDNIPVVSWLALGRRCRTCKVPISARYPAVEMAVAVLFAGVTLAVRSHWAVIGLCVLAAALVASATIELDGDGPTPVVAAVGGGVGLVALVAAAVADHLWAHVGGAGAGAAAALLLVVAVRPQSRGANSALAWDAFPALVVLGWSGAAGAGAGLVVAAVMARLMRPRHLPGVVGLVAAAGAVVVAVLAGPALGT